MIRSHDEGVNHVVDIPKSYKLTLYMNDEWAGNISSTPKDLHILADWIKVNVPLSLADMRDRDEDMQLLAKAFFARLERHDDPANTASIVVRMDYSDIAGAIGGIWDEIDGRGQIKETASYLRGLYDDLPSWLQQHYGNDGD